MYLDDYNRLMNDVIIGNPETHPHTSKLIEFVTKHHEYIKNMLDVSLKRKRVVPRQPMEHPIGMMAIMELVYRRAQMSTKLLGMY